MKRLFLVFSLFAFGCADSAGSAAGQGAGGDTATSTSTATDTDTGTGTDTGGPFPPQANDTSSVGMGLSPPAFSSDVVFVDLLHQTTGFLTADLSAAYAPVDAKGFPTSVTGSDEARLLLVQDDMAAKLPTGTYILLYRGTGDVQIEGPPGLSVGEPTVLADGSKRSEIQYKPTGEGDIMLSITASDAGDPIRDVHYLLPGSEATYQTDWFNPAFLKWWGKYGVMRYLHQQTFWDFAFQAPDPGTPPVEVNWSDRAPLERLGWASRWPHEVIIRLSNTLHADPWVNVPYAVTLDYTKAMAALYKEQLDQELNVYVEYSNECWNGISTAYAHAVKEGVKAGLYAPDAPGEEYHTAVNYCAVQTVEHTNAFRDVFTAPPGKREAVRVFGAFFEGLDIYARETEGGDPAGALYEARTSFKRPAYQDVDVVAIATYFGAELGVEENLPLVQSWTLDEIFAYFSAGTVPAASQGKGEFNDPIFGIPATLAAVKAYSDVTKSLGLKLVAYEGGPHLVPLDDNPAADQLFRDAIRDPRMGKMMTQLLDGAQGAGLTLHVLHNSAELPGPLATFAKFGSIEHTYQAAADAPKWLATDAWIDANPKPWTSLVKDPQ